MQIEERSTPKTKIIAAKMPEKGTQRGVGIPLATPTTGKKIKTELIPSVGRSLLSSNSLTKSSINQLTKIEATDKKPQPQMKTLKSAALAKMYKKAKNRPAAMRNILSQFMRDLTRRVNQIAPKDSKELINLINQFDAKWRAFARRIQGVNKDGFLYLLEKEKRAVWDLYASGTNRSSVVQKIDALQKFKNKG